MISVNIQKIIEYELTILGMKVQLSPIVPNDEVWIATKDELMKFVVLAEEPPSQYVLERITNYA